MNYRLYNIIKLNFDWRKFVYGLFVVSILFLVQCSDRIDHVEEISKVASIFPDYYDLTIPANIAPLNFIIREEGSEYKINIHGKKGSQIEINQHSAKVEISETKWHQLLSENKGDSITIEIWSYNKSRWNKFKSIQHYIAPELIDEYLSYRLVYASYLKWAKMGIYQRNLSNFDETPVIENETIDYACVNCHTFSDNDPDKFMMHFRIFNAGTLIKNGDKLEKFNMKATNALSAGIYASWSPNGKYLAFSTGKIAPHMTTRLNKTVDVADKSSDLMIYDVEHNRLEIPPQLATERRENLPLWSADGRYLYFTSAPEAIENDFESRLHARYDLMRIEFNENTNEWGNIDTLVSSSKTKKSISMPSASPDGRYISCSMSDYGYFTIFHKESDLYLIDTKTGEYKKMELNSDETESYSSWSSNSRWLVFSSKRLDGVLTRPYIAYIDKNGSAHNAFLLPQKNPEMYNQLLANYNLPEMIKGKINITPFEIRNKISEEPIKVIQ